jgi:hypothetical protein
LLFVLPILGELMTLMLQDQEFLTAKAIEAAPSLESQLSGRTAFFHTTAFRKIENKLLSQ